MSATTMQILQAYKAVMDPMTAHQQRAAATAFLEKIKQQPAVCREAAVELLRMPLPEARHLAAVLMENVVKLHWTTLQPGQRAQVRKDVAAILANVNTQETNYVREKIASVVNEAAKRDWPHDWPEYFDTLVAISNLGDHQRFMVLLVLRRLVEDVTHFSHDLAKKRCDALLAELKAKAKPMIAFMVQGLGVQLAAWRESQGRNEMAARLGVALIETMAGFLSWAAPAVIFDSNVPELLMSCLGEAHELRMPAAEALLLLVERDTGKMSIAPKFLFPLEQTTIFACALESMLGTAQQRLLFQETLGKILVAAGKRHLVMVEKHNYPVPPSYPDYLSLMGRFLEHQDLVFCETTIPFFNHLLRTEVFKASPAFDKVAPALASAFTRKLVGGVNPEALNLLREGHFMDGDDGQGEKKERLGDFVARFTAVLKDVVRKLALARPVLVLEVALEQVTGAIGRVRSAPPPPATAKNATQSAVYLLMQGCVELVDAVMKNGVPFEEMMAAGAVGSQRVRDQLSEGVKRLLLLFFDFETPSPVLMSLKIKSLRSFSAYYRRNAKVLTAVLERLLVVVLFRAPGEEKKAHVDLDKTTLRLRKEACDSFLRLCVELPDVLVDQLGSIANHVVEKLIKGDTTFTEKAVLRDALVAISTVLRDQQQQKTFVQLVLGPVLAAWTAPVMTETVGDCEKLLAWVGAAAGAQPKWDNGRALVAVLETFRSTMKRSPGATTDLLPALLPNVFVLCRTLHRLWKPGHAAHQFLKTHLAAVFAPDQSLYANLVGRKQERNFALFVAAWLSETRETTYKVIGVACKLPHFYQIPDLATKLNSFVFAEITHMSVQHLTVLVEFVIENLLMHTPENAYGPFLAPLLPRLFSFLLERLFGCWALESAVKTGETGQNTEDEVVQTKLAMDLSRSWFRVLLHVLHVEKNPNLKGKDGYATASSLCNFMISSPDVVAGLLVTLTSALCDTCDSQTLSHAMEILERLVGVLLNNAALHAALGGHVLRALLKAVSKRANNEHVGRFLRVSAEIYVRLRGTSPLPLSVLKMTGVTATQIAGMEARLRADTDKKTPKNRAQAMQETLGDFVGSDVVGLGEGRTQFAAEYIRRVGS